MSACECGKVRYLTRKHARREACRFHRTHGKLRAYQCDGGFWHLTSRVAERVTAWRNYDQRTQP